MVENIYGSRSTNVAKASVMRNNYSQPEIRIMARAYAAYVDLRHVAPTWQEAMSQVRTIYHLRGNASPNDLYIASQLRNGHYGGLLSNDEIRKSWNRSMPKDTTVLDLTDMVDCRIACDDRVVV